MSSERVFPIVPTSSFNLEIGDIIPVPANGRWACLQVTDLTRNGPGSRTIFIAGVLDWSGPEPPTPAAVETCTVLEQGLPASNSSRMVTWK